MTESIVVKPNEPTDLIDHGSLQINTRIEREKTQAVEIEQTTTAVIGEFGSAAKC